MTLPPMARLDVGELLCAIHVPVPGGGSRTGAGLGERDGGVQGAHLNPLGLCLRTSTPCIWRILSTFRPA